MGEDGVPPGSVPPGSVRPGSDWSGSERSGSVPPGNGPATEPIPAMTWLLRDWWDPTWDEDWWGPVRDVAQATGAGGEVVAPAAGPATPEVQRGRPGGGPGMRLRGVARPAAADRARTAAAPSWGRVLATTVSLSVSRRLTRPRGSRARLVAAAMLGAGLLGTAAGAAGLLVTGHSLTAAVRPTAKPSSVPVPPGRAVTPVWLATVQQTARPVWLTIPAIGVRAAVVQLGLNPDGTLQVPTSTTVTGWYTGSPRPGAIGSAIIVGHVDSRAGPGVFFWLRTMRPGERVYVRRADGTLAVFTVTRVHMYAKDHFPTAAVYGPVPDAELRLITCGGVFDPSLGSYLSNVVVYARLTG
jgi:Sortase domain